MSAPVFSYGTLEFDEVIEFVTGARFAGVPGRLLGFARYGVRGASYPGIIPQAGAETPGTLYRGMDASTLARLDDYEASFYERRWLPIETPIGRVEAWVWVVAAPLRHHLSSEPWSKQAFARSELGAFLREIGAR